MSLIPLSSSHWSPSTLVTSPCFTLIAPYYPNQYATLLALCSFFPLVEKKDLPIVLGLTYSHSSVKAHINHHFTEASYFTAAQSPHPHSLSISLALNMSMRRLNIRTIEFVLSHVMCKWYPHSAVSIHQNYR